MPDPAVCPPTAHASTPAASTATPFRTILIAAPRSLLSANCDFTYLTSARTASPARAPHPEPSASSRDRSVAAPASPTPVTFDNTQQRPVESRHLHVANHHVLHIRQRDSLRACSGHVGQRESQPAACADEFPSPAPARAHRSRGYSRSEIRETAECPRRRERETHPACRCSDCSGAEIPASRLKHQSRSP